MNAGMPQSHLKLMQAAYRDPLQQGGDAIAREIVPVQVESEEKLGDTLKNLLAGKPVNVEHARSFLEQVDTRIKDRHKSFLRQDDRLRVEWVTEADGVLALGLNVVHGEKPCAGITTYINVTPGASEADMYISPIGHPRVRSAEFDRESGNRWQFEHSHIRF